MNFFDSFNPKAEDFKSYQKRFEEFMTLNGMKKNEKRATQLFLNSLGTTGFRLLTRQLSSDVNPYEYKYPQLIDLLLKHYQPQKSEIITMHEFLLKHQDEHQSITEYSEELKRSLKPGQGSNNCQNCKNCVNCISMTENVLLRTQFIRGLRDKSIQEEMLKSPLTKFEEIEQLALALEDAKNGCAILPRSNHHSRGNTRILMDYNEKSSWLIESRKSRSNSQEQSMETRSLRCGKTNNLSSEYKTMKEYSSGDESDANVNVSRKWDKDIKDEKKYKVTIKIAGGRGDH